MNLKSSGIMSENPTACLPGDTVAHVARLMKENDVGSIPVVEDNEGRRLAGIVTDRDVVIRIVAAGLDPGATRVEDAMTREVVAVGPDDEVSRVLEAMEKSQVRRIPVVESDGRLVGIIAQADIAVRLEAPKETAEIVEKISTP